MKLNIDRIKNNDQTFLFDKTIKDFDLGSIDFYDDKDIYKNENEPVKVTCETEMIGTEIHVRFEIQCQLTLSCFRCLEDVKTPIDTNGVKVIKINNKKSTIHAEEVPDFLIIDEKTREIDIHKDVRDHLILALPRKVLCKEECNGLCPRCGTNLNYKNCDCEKNIDPRLSVLKKFLHH